MTLRLSNDVIIIRVPCVTKKIPLWNIVIIRVLPKIFCENL